MEVSRTKLRKLGFDFAEITNGTNIVRVGRRAACSSAAAATAASRRAATRRSASSIVNGGSAVLRRARGPAPGQPGEDPGRADPGDHQRPAGLLPRRRRVSATSCNGGITGHLPSSSRNTARRSISCPSCWATAGSAWRSAPASARSTAASSVDGSPCPADPRGRYGRRDARRPDAGHRRPGADSASRPRTAACPGSARCRTSAPPSAGSRRRSTRSNC